MSQEPDNKPKVVPPPIKLDYATHVGAYPIPQPPPRVAVLLVGLAALTALWSILLGVASLGDLTIFGWALIGAGVFLFWGTFGKLSAKRTRPKAALLVLSVSLTIYLPVIVMANEIYTRNKAHFERELEMTRSNYTAPATDAEQQVYTFSLIRDTAAVASLLGATSCIYASTRLMVRRKT
jgi:hypothetical protein